MKTWLKRNLPALYYRLYRTQFVTLPGHNVEYAFSCEGKRYYQFTNGPLMYYERYMAAMDKIRELEQNVDREFLEVWCRTATEFLNKGELVNVAAMVHQLAQRINYMGNLELLYKLASVWFFTDEENVYTYDPVVGDRKIEVWKQHADVLAFFLKSPLRHYLPSPDTLLGNIQSYTKGMTLEEIGQWRFRLPILSKLGVGSDTISSIESRLRSREEWLKSVE